jgi:hypothetical protein
MAHGPAGAGGRALVVFIIDTKNMGPELQGGLLGVVGSARPTAEEKKECLEEVSRYVAEGTARVGSPADNRYRQ